MRMAERLYGGIEGGGTKFICVVAGEPDHVLAETRIATTDSAQTLAAVIAFFRPFADSGEIHTLGLGTFGPLDLERGSPTFGSVLPTTKEGWSNTDMLGTLQSALGIRVAIDTDVNAAALGEYTWGACAGVDPCLYLTVGTGIGGGYIKDGRPLQGMQHTEMGHLRIPHDLKRDPFAGVCSFHGDCFEGLASGPAIQARLDEPGEGLPDDDPFWDIEADYIAAALMNYILVLSPRRIVLGGGVMQRKFLIPIIQSKVQAALGGYIANPLISKGIETYIVAPGLGNRSGVLGAIALAMRVEADTRG
jgi:fructokinase